MSVWLDLLENMLDFSVRPDDEGCAGDTHHLLAIHVLLFQNSKGDSDLLVGISQQREGQLLVFLEFLLRFGSIRRDAKQHGARLLNLFICVAEPASLYGSTWGIRPRIKKQNNGFAAQAVEGYLRTVLVLQSKVGGFIIDFHANCSTKLGIECNRTRTPVKINQNFTLPKFVSRSGHDHHQPGVRPVACGDRRRPGGTSTDYPGRTQGPA